MHAAAKGNQESDLRPLFFPEAIAVVVASRREEAIDRKVVGSLLTNHFPKPIYPINPSATDFSAFFPISGKIAMASRCPGTRRRCDVWGIRTWLILLKGGKPPGDEAALKDLLLRGSSLAENFPAIKTLDLNPVMALPPGEGCTILDARIGIGK